MPGLFDKFGIRFQYPENWTIETDETAAGRREVSVYSPGGGFWTVVVPTTPAEPTELVETALMAMQKEYDELDSEAVREEIGEIELIGYDVNFYCLDLTNTAWIRACQTPTANYLLLCQAEDREFDKVSEVFRAMTFSLLSN